MEIVNINKLTAAQIAQAAQILTDTLPLGWPTFADAQEEIRELRAHEPEAVFLAAVSEGEVIGWCGILPKYNGNVFELHPLCVRPDFQRKGIGTKLMEAIEAVARERGGITMWIGADDEKPGGETSFANVDLYDNLPERIRAFNPGTHQTAFYLKMGYSIVGVMPDANGVGKPDIYLAKRL